MPCDPLRAPRTCEEAIASSLIGFGDLVLEPVEIRHDLRNRRIEIHARFGLGVGSRLDLAQRTEGFVMLVLPLPGSAPMLAQIVCVTHTDDASGRVVFACDDRKHWAPILAGRCLQERMPPLSMPLPDDDDPTDSTPMT